MHAVTCDMLRAHTAGVMAMVGAGARAGGAYACIGVGGAYRPVQCCRDTVLRVEPSLHSQRLSS